MIELRGVAVAMATRILFTRERKEVSVILALDYREGSRRVGKVHGTDLEREITKIVRVTGHGNLENKGWRVVRIFDIVVSREKFSSPPCP